MNSRQVQTSAPLNALFPKLKNEQSHRKRDNVNDDYDLIQALPLNRSISIMKHSTSLIYLTAPLIAYRWIVDEAEILREIHPNGIKFMDILSSEHVDFYVFFAGYIVLAYGLRWATKKLPLRIYRCKEKWVDQADCIPCYLSKAQLAIFYLFILDTWPYLKVQCHSRRRRSILKQAMLLNISMHGIYTELLHINWRIIQFCFFRHISNDIPICTRCCHLSRGNSTYTIMKTAVELGLM